MGWWSRRSYQTTGLSVSACWTHGALDSGCQGYAHLIASEFYVFPFIFITKIKNKKYFFWSFDHGNFSKRIVFLFLLGVWSLFINVVVSILQHDVDAGVLKKVILADGAVVTVKGAWSVSLRYPIDLPLPLNMTDNGFGSGLMALAEHLRHASRSQITSWGLSDLHLVLSNCPPCLKRRPWIPYPLLIYNKKLLQF